MQKSCPNSAKTIRTMIFSRVKAGFFLLLLLLFLLHVSYTSSEPLLLTIDVSQAKKLLESGHVFLDVRTVEEYEKGHVSAEKIFNVPYCFFTPQGREKNPNFLQHVSSVCNETDHIIVGCKSGVRSLLAAKDLIASGFESVRNMEGGYVEWENRGFSIELQHKDEL